MIADSWSYKGVWSVFRESALSGEKAGMILRFQAGEVHIVAGNRGSGPE